MFNLKLNLTHLGEDIMIYFEKWLDDGTSYGNKANPFQQNTFNATATLKHYMELHAHYDALLANGTITNLSIKILKAYTDEEVTVEVVKAQIIEDIKDLKGAITFDPRNLTENEKLAVFFTSQYISMQEQLNANRSVLFRDYLEDNMPLSMHSDIDDIMISFKNLSLEIIGNEKDTLIQNDEPESDVENKISMPV